MAQLVQSIAQYMTEAAFRGFLDNYSFLEIFSSCSVVNLYYTIFSGYSVAKLLIRFQQFNPISSKLKTSAKPS